MFTICVLIFASLSAEHPMKTECRENRSELDVKAADAACSGSKDPLTTCEMVRVDERSYVIYLRKLEGT